MQDNFHKDATLIDALGGPTALAKKCAVLSGEHMTSQCVSNWRKRGIPPRWRVAVANMAVMSGIAVPSGFGAALNAPPSVDYGDVPEFLRRRAG